jgi:pimeloyl-ACP methyl ester carboxylesterase
MAVPLTTVVLPGLDGSARLLAPFLKAADGRLALRPIAYPPDEAIGYDALEAWLRPQLPASEPFGLVAESFSGPLALRIAARPPPNLVGLALSTTFHRRPIGALLSVLSPLAPLLLRLPLTRAAVRLLLAGDEAPIDLVDAVRAAVAAVPSRTLIARASEALRVDATPDLRAARVPILLLAGRHDRLLRGSIIRDIRWQAPRTTIHLFDAPHLVLQLRAHQAMQEIASFLLRAAAQHGADGRDEVARAR